jgi:uncharacterized RDD family membrane protein YckC
MKPTFLLALVFAVGGSIGPAAGPAAAQDFDHLERMSWSHVALRVGQDYVLREGESVRDVVVVWGRATIDGHIRGDVTVVFGTLQLGRTAVIDGSLEVVGGTAKIAPGAVVRENLAVIGGGIDGPPDFLPGRDHFVIGSAEMFERARFIVPWLTQGLLMGRPIAPGVDWVWTVVVVFFVISLLLNLIFLDGVTRCAQALAARPLRTFLTGLLVLLLIGPLTVILAASVVGLAVVPFLLCAVVIAWTLGKVGVATWIGGAVLGQPVPETRIKSVVAFALGFAVIIFVYIVPVLGLMIWGLVGVMGLGAATSAFTTAYRRENRKAPKPVPPPPPLEPPPMSYAEPEMPPLVPPVPPPAPAAFDSAPASAAFDDAPPGAPAVSLPPPAPPSPLFYFPRATFVDRLGAFALDCALVIILREGLDIAHRENALIMLLVAYHVVLWTWKGTTVGGIICQVRLIRVDGQPVRLPDAVVRGLSSLLSLGAFGIGCLWILRDPERQAWHDKIAGTYVVKVPRNYPLP